MNDVIYSISSELLLAFFLHTSKNDKGNFHIFKNFFRPKTYASDHLDTFIKIFIEKYVHSLEDRIGFLIAALLHLQ